MGTVYVTFTKSSVAMGAPLHVPDITDGESITETFTTPTISTGTTNVSPFTQWGILYVYAAADPVWVNIDEAASSGNKIFVPSDTPFWLLINKGQRPYFIAA